MLARRVIPCLDVDRGRVETRDYDDLLDCCGILAELGDGIEVRRVVREDERVR